MLNLRISFRLLLDFVVVFFILHFCYVFSVQSLQFNVCYNLIIINLTIYLYERDTPLLAFKEVEVRVKELLLSVTVNSMSLTIQTHCKFENM